jgi:hypothetical protein
MAGFSVQEFSSALPKGGARSGLFQCKLSFPDGIIGVGEAAKRYTLTAHAASIPSSTIEPTDVSYFGRTFSIPGTRTFEDWSTTIYNTEDYLVRNAFERWSEHINDHETNQTGVSSLGLDSGDTAAYTQDITVELINKKGVLNRTYKLFDAWPTAIGAVDLAWEGNDIQTFEVTWSYNYWKVLRPLMTVE